MRARLHHIILDSRDPARLAQFYSELLGLPITFTSNDFLVVSADQTTSGLGFQLAPNHEPPDWPSGSSSQQIHLDVMVEDVERAAAEVIALGATALAGSGVFADPAGHPFCLVARPDWASPW